MAPGKPKSKNRAWPGHQAPAGYDASAYERPSVACDVVIVRFIKSRLEVLLIERSHDPYQGYWALPGGFVEIHEALEVAAAREVEEETGVTGLDLIPLGAFGDPGRDPRTRVISSVYLALVRAGQLSPRAGDDARETRWAPLLDPPGLAFDHAKILTAARQRLLELALLSPRIFDLLPPVFSRGDFMDLARELTGRRYDLAAFNASIDHVPGFEPVRDESGRDDLHRYDPARFHVGDFMFLLLGDAK